MFLDARERPDQGVDPTEPLTEGLQRAYRRLSATRNLDVARTTWHPTGVAERGNGGGSTTMPDILGAGGRISVCHVLPNVEELTGQPTVRRRIGWRCSRRDDPKSRASGSMLETTSISQRCLQVGSYQTRRLPRSTMRSVGARSVTRRLSEIERERKREAEEERARRRGRAGHLPARPCRRSGRLAANARRACKRRLRRRCPPSRTRSSMTPEPHARSPSTGVDMLSGMRWPAAARRRTTAGRSIPTSS